MIKVVPTVIDEDSNKDEITSDPTGQLSEWLIMLIDDRINKKLKGIKVKRRHGRI